MIYLKKSALSAETGQPDVRASVEAMLAEIERDGDAAAIRFARDLDKWQGDIIVTPEVRAKAAELVPEKLKGDIRFAHRNIGRFAEAQRATIMDCSIEVLPGLMAGQKQIPVGSAGCYVPGGRYNHIASEIMTITTAKVAGVPHITASSPPRPGVGIPPAISLRAPCQILPR
jgi:sulfopropanediol 3-dehydrogenase